MDYYKLFFDLSEQYGCLDFSFPINYEDYELLKIEYDPMVEFDSPIEFDVDFDSGKDELDLNLSQGGVSEDPIRFNSGTTALHSYVEDSSGWIDVFGLSSYNLKKNMHKANEKLAGIFGVMRRGWHRGKGSAAHHIVAENDSRAQRSRVILASVGIDIDDARNGIFLSHADKNSSQPGVYHRVIHTDTYYATVEDRLEQAIKSGGGRKAVLREYSKRNNAILIVMREVFAVRHNFDEFRFLLETPETSKLFVERLIKKRYNGMPARCEN